MGGIIGTARGGEVAIAAREADRKLAVDGRPMSRAIDNDLLRSAKEEDTYHKLLLLGAGESGKSTFFKQVQQLYGRGFHSEADRRPYLPPIHSNVIDSIKKLVEQARLMAQHAAVAAAQAAAANAAAFAAAHAAAAAAAANGGVAEPATPVSNVNHTPTPQPLNPHAHAAHAAAIAAAAALPGAIGGGGGGGAAGGDGKPDPLSFASDAAASTASGSGSGSVSHVSTSASVLDGAAAAGAGAGAVPQLKPVSDAHPHGQSHAHGHARGAGGGSSTPQRTSPKTNASNTVAHVVADVPLPNAATRKASGGDGSAAAAAAAGAGAGAAGAVPNGVIPPGIPPGSPIAAAIVAAAAAAAAEGRPPLPRARTKGSGGAAGAAAAAAAIASGSVNAIPISRANEHSAEFVASLPSQAMVTPEVARHVKLLWADPAIKNAFEMRAAFQLPDTCAYLFERIDAIGAPEYVPSYEDVLHVRARTTGIAETTFGMEGGAKFRLMDVGGQRNERKKWINMFDKVTAVIFVVAMSEYDQMMFEDAVTNRMQDALQLFADTCNLRWFEDTSIILFLNKNDIFQQKIKKVDLKVCFPDYTGGCNYDRAYQWIRKKFLACNLTPDKKKIYSHITCATNTSNVNFTFHVVKDIVIKRNLKDFGLIT